MKQTSLTWAEMENGETVVPTLTGNTNVMLSVLLTARCKFSHIYSLYSAYSLSPMAKEKVDKELHYEILMLGSNSLPQRFLAYR